MVLLQHSGRCLIGVGSADGENHALEAATRAVDFPLLTPERLNQAKQCFVFMRGGCDMSIKEVMEMSTHVRHLACEACIFSVGVYTDATPQEAMHVALIAVDSTPGD